MARQECSPYNYPIHRWCWPLCYIYFHFDTCSRLNCLVSAISIHNLLWLLHAFTGMFSTSKSQKDSVFTFVWPLWTMIVAHDQTAFYCELLWLLPRYTGMFSTLKCQTRSLLTYVNFDISSWSNCLVSAISFTNYIALYFDVLYSFKS